jgi:hypothetical protein
MKKASFIITLSLIMVFLTGHYFIYKSVLKSHKKEFKAFIRSNYVKSEQLEINPSQLYTDNPEMQWLDKNKEVCLNGVMYDILSIKNEGTKVILNVVKDKDEKELMNRYQDQFNDIYENTNSGKKEHSLLKDFYGLKFLNTDPFSFQNAGHTVVSYFTTGNLPTRDHNGLVYSPPEIL